tara:strand:- start:525 stop:1244 length:720 start_codon:yes stop_codon:yes gene_type:complete
MFPHYSHPFINNLPMRDIKEKPKFLILYRLNFLNNIPFIEFYFKDYCFQEIKIKNEIELFASIDVNGKKSIMGFLDFQEREFIFVQLKNNRKYDENNWVVMYDILINKGRFYKKFEKSVFDFFLHNHKVADIYLDKKLSIAPCVYYTRIEDSFLYFLKKNHILTYSNKKPFIELYPYFDNSNICCLCFHEDTLCNSTDSNLILKNALFNVKNNFSAVFIKDNSPYWIFKNQTNIIFFIK